MSKSKTQETLKTPKFLWFSNESLQKKTYWAECLRKLRRAYFSIFHSDYIQKSTEQERKGDCHRCGACCKLVYDCPFLGNDSQNLPYCRIYGDLRPGTCKSYPFDKYDSEIDQCGFKFS